MSTITIRCNTRCCTELTNAFSGHGIKPIQPAVSGKTTIVQFDVSKFGGDIDWFMQVAKAWDSEAKICEPLKGCKRFKAWFGGVDMPFIAANLRQAKQDAFQAMGSEPRKVELHEDQTDWKIG